MLHVAWCGMRFAHWFHHVKVILCDSQRLPAVPLALFAQVILCSDMEVRRYGMLYWCGRRSHLMNCSYYGHRRRKLLRRELS